MHFATAPARALFAYLALEAARPLARVQLAELLWPEQTTEIAFSNLRQTLMRVRKAIPDPPGAQAVLHTTKGTIQFKREGAASDVSRFEDLLAECALHPHADITRCPDCIARLQEAAALYRGEFLSGLFVDGSQPFEEWVLFKREQLHRQALEALTVLAQHSEATGQFEAMRKSAARQLALEPWREEAYAQLMRALTYLGDRSAALAQYETCRQLLGAELGIEPRRELRELAERIRTGALEKPHTSVLPAPSQPITYDARDWNDIPEAGPLFGRAGELEQLQRWLGRERSRLVWVLGIGGVGKTSLAAAAARATSRPGDVPDPVGQVGRNKDKDSPFEVVIWRSLLNAPPIEEILRAVVQTLSRGRMAELPVSWDEQLACLVDLLRQRRCLLVLDNFESILQVGDAETYRAGYQRYGQLVQCLAQSPHDSCLLITSREQPRETARIVGGAGVQVLRLTGLAPEAGRAMLAAYQLGEAADTDQAAEAEALVQRYSGNPLALKLVAQTVQELFMGNIGDFLSADAAIFDDVRTVLDQQFERLSPLEREILVWLAVEREATALSALREDLVHAPAPREFLEALRALQRRSLLEQVNPGRVGDSPMTITGGGMAFTLQNVIMEYVTEKLVEEVTREIYSPIPLPVPGSGTGIAGDLRLTSDDLGAPNRHSSFVTRQLNRFSLIQARAKEYVLQSQIRLILKPVADRVLTKLGQAEFEHRLQRLLGELHALPPRAPGYEAGNILNLALHQGFDTSGYDFSRLSVWQADLREASFAVLDFREADLANAAFIQAIDVAAVKFIASGQALVAGIEGGDLCLWRIAGGQLQDAFRTPSRSGYPIVFNDDGRLLATCGLDHRIRVWSAESGALLQTLEGHTDQIFNPVFSHDGMRLASGGRDGTVRMWDVQSGQPLHVLSVAESGDLITGLAFSPDDAVLAGGGSRGVVWLWDFRRNGQLIRKLHGHTRELECCAFSPDGAFLASGSHDGVIRIWDASGEYVQELRGHGLVVRVLAFHPGGHVLASGSADRTIRLWDVRRGQALHTLAGHAHEVITLSFNPDGDVLASGSADKTIRQWDTRTGHTLEIISSYAKMVDAVQWSPAAPVLASGGADGVIRLWHVQDDSVRHFHDRRAARVLAIAFSPDGLRLASAGADHAVHVWDVASGKPIGALRGHAGSVNAVAFSPDGRLIASGSSDRTIRLWTVDMVQPNAGPQVVVLSGHEDVVISVSFSPNGRTLLSGSLDHTARLWDVADCREVAELRGHTSALYGATFTPDGRWVVTNSWNYTVVAWDAATGQRVEWPGSERIRARGIAFSPDGATVACVTKEQGIELRNFYTGELLQTLRGHAMTIRSLNFSSDGAILASGSWDGEIRLWDTTTGACLRTLRAQGPYAGMNITGVTGISEAQQAALRALGAVNQQADDRQ